MSHQIENINAAIEIGGRGVVEKPNRILELKVHKLKLISIFEGTDKRIIEN